MIDPDLAVGAELGTVEGSWDPPDVILYHLGLGCTALRDVYERDLRVLPTFPVLQAAQVVDAFLGTAPGMDFDPAQVLHGEQRVELLAPLPAAADWTCSGRIAAVHDKGSAAVTVVDTSMTVGGTEVARTRYTLFMRGAGGFGGDRGPAPEPFAELGTPDTVVTLPVAANAAQLYRLSGDRNPLHVDPEAARRVGFERPILHGLCTYGMACRALVDGVLDGRADELAALRARFTGVVFPGDELTVRMHRDGGTVALEAGTAAGAVLRAEAALATP